MKKFLTAVLLTLVSVFSGCGGSAPSDMGPFEPGLVGQYELVELHGEGVDLYHVEGSARLGDMLLQDDNTYEQNFGHDVEDLLGYFGAKGHWSATLSTIYFDGTLLGYDTSKLNDIGADIGDTLTIEDGEFVFVWLKVTIAPRN